MASGLERLDELAEAGFDRDEILSYKEREKDKLIAAGFSNAEASEYWGDPVIGPMSNDEYRRAAAEFTQTWLPHHGAKEATNIGEVWRAGFQASATGLAINEKLPDLAVPENASTFDKVVSGAATLAGDFPWMVAGGMVGGVSGAPTGPGAALTGAGAAFALPAAVRELLVQKYEKGEVETFGQFWERFSGALIEAGKGYLTGVATVGAGQAVKGAQFVKGLPKPLPTAAPLAAEITTLTAVGSALEGEVPTAEDFVVNSVLLGGLKAVKPTVRGVYRAKESLAPTGQHILRNLERVYARTGRRPAEVVEDAKSDPSILEDIASTNRQIPRAYEELAKAEEARSKPKDTEGEGAAGAEPTPRAAEAGGATEIGPRVAVDFAGGGTMEAAMGKHATIHAAEIDPKVSAEYNRAHGTNFKPQNVHDVAPAQIANADLYHASPVCKSLSPANIGRKVMQRDIDSAEKIASNILVGRPRTVSIENVPEFATKPELMDPITRALDEAGYTWDVLIHDAADYGGAMTRKRMVIRAVRDGDLPPVPAKREPGDWYKVIEDLIDDAPDAPFGKPRGKRAAAGKGNWEQARITEMAEKGELDLSEPIITMGGSAGSAVAYARNAGVPAPTLKATSKEKARIILPDGRVKELTTRMMARLMGLPDSFRIPEDKGLAKTILGNGIHAETTRNFIEPLAQVGARSEAPTPRAGEPQVPPQAEQRMSIESELTSAREEAARIAKTSAKELREQGVIGKDGEFTTKKAAVEAAKEKVSGLQERLLDLAREPEGEPADPAGLALERDAAVDHILGKVVRGARDKPERPDFNTFYRLFVDRLDPIRRAVESMEPEAATEANAYRLMRMLSSASAKAEHFITRGTFDFKTLAETGPSMRSIFDRHPGELDGLRSYLVSARVLELSERGVETGIDVGKARQVVDKYASRYEQSRADLFEFQGAVLKYAKDAGVISQKTFELMLEANKNYVPFHRLMDPRPGKAGATIGATTPLYRIKGSEREILDPLESIILNTHMLIRAADRAHALDQFFSMVERTGRDDLARKKKRKVRPITLDEGEAKKFARLFSEQMELTEEQARQLEIGFTEELAIFRPAASQVRETGEVVRMNKGKKEVWQLDPEIAEAIATLDQVETNAFIKFLEGPAKLLRAGAVLSPEFMARNPIRDTFVAYLQSDSGFRLFADSVWGAFSVASTYKPTRGAVKAVAGKARAKRLENLYYEWMRSGGPMAELVALDRRYLATDIRKLDGQLKMTERVRNYVDPRNIVEVLRLTSQMMEQATRVGEYGRARKQGASIREAGFRSRDVSLDFARAGSVAKEINKAAAFFNAQIQGHDLLLKNAKENPQRFLAKGFASITLPSIAIYAYANSTEQRRRTYAEIPDWQRDWFWVFPVPSAEATGVDRDFGLGVTAEYGGEVWARMPKPFVYGYLFGTIPEKSMAHILEHDPDALDGVLDTLLQQGMVSPMPSGPLVAVELYANRSMWTNRPIIPTDRERLLPEFQYSPYTTALSKQIGRVLSDLPFGMSEVDLPLVGPLRFSQMSSPAAIDYTVRGLTAGLGSTVWKLVSDGLEASGLVPETVDPAKTWSDIPVVKGFMVRHPTMAAQSIADFYDRSQPYIQKAETYTTLVRAGEVDQAMRLLDRDGYEIESLGGLSGIRSEIGAAANAANGIWIMPGWTPEEKRHLIDQLYIQAIGTARLGLEIIDDFEQSPNQVVPQEQQRSPEPELPPVSLVPPEPVRTPRFEIQDMGWSLLEGVSGETLDPGAVEVLRLAKERIRYHSKDADLVVTDAERTRDQQRKLNQRDGKAEGWVSGHESDVAIDIRGHDFTQKQREDIAYFVKTRATTPGIQYEIAYKDKHIHFEWDSL